MKKLTFMLICLLAALTCQGRTITVDNDGPADFNNIQAAIDDSNDGDVVIVAPGTYTGDGNRDIDFKGKTITVKSENGPENCIIDCQNSGRGFYFHNYEDANSILDGLTITNGYAEYGGGGILCGQSSPTITNCTISGNSTYYNGGGIYCGDSSPTITNCTITGNTSYGGGGCGGGGGIYCGGIYCGDSSPTITNCTISGNSTYFNGGGIYCRYSSPTITNCTISENSTEIGTGGGICCERDSNPTITNCTITGNSARYDGGGIIFWGGDTVVTNCILWNNQAPDGPEIYLKGQSNASVNYSDVRGGQGNVYVDPDGTLNWGTGNIDENPHFAFSTDYHLMPTSPCIDAGTNTPAAGLPATDIDGNPRPLDGNGDGTAIADIGAYEYNPSSSPIIAVSSSALSFYSVQGLPRPAPQTLLIRNCGVGTLNWQIVEDSNWLYVTPTSGASTGNINEVTLTVDHNSLTLGDYSCVFYVLDPDAVNSPVRVEVGLHVGALLCVPQQFLTIQAAIDAANDYDMVLVAPGTYTGAGNCDIDFRGKPVTVKSETGPDNCIIDWQDQGRGFYFHSNEQSDSIVDGFTITTNYVSGGTGISCWEASPTIRNCIISGGGYGIYCRNSSPIITNCTITGNTSYGAVGGGVYCDQNSNPIITDCAITANQGSGIACWDSSPTITNCNISGNSGGQGLTPSGGGICCDRDSNPTIANCTITGNSAEGEGGAIHCGRDSSPTITNCTISGNLTKGKWGRGGAISCEWQSNPTITNCTITGNSAKYEGGGISCWDGSPVITNCILWNNSDSEGTDESAQIWSWWIPPIVNYSCIQNWTGALGGVGNTGEDPCFVSPGCWADANDSNIIVEPNDPNAMWVDGDYHLKSFGWRWDSERQGWDYDEVTSRCIDAGNPGLQLINELMSVPDDPDNEWGENIRINMGTYGSTAEASMPPYDWALLSDMTNNGTVDFIDYAHLADMFSDQGEELPGDFDRDGDVDLADLGLLVQDWLQETSWH